MYKIINRHVYEIASGENITLCDIVADTSTDLPGADDISVYKIAFGSFAYVIDEGVFYSLDSSGTWNGGAYSDVVTEVVTARGSFSSLDARLDDMDVILNSAKLGVKYKGAVNYYNDLLATGNEIGDAYTVKYAGSSGTTPDGTEYVWGELGGVAQWIDFSKDCYTKSEINTMLAGKVNVEAGKGLSSNDFTDADKSQIETNKNNILKDEAALVELVDGGAKSLLPNNAVSQTLNSVVFVVNADGSVNAVSGTASTAVYLVMCRPNLKKGRYVISGSDGEIGVGIGSDLNSSSIIVLSRNGNPVEFELANDTNDLYYFVRMSTGVTANNNTVYPMLCTKAAWDISQTYQPYRPSYQELYDRVVALENNP